MGARVRLGTSIAWTIAVALACGGCGSGEEEPTGPAMVQLALDNHTTANAPFWEYTGNDTPDQLGVRFLAVRLGGRYVEDMPLPDRPIIYLNPACTDFDSCSYAPAGTVSDRIDILQPDDDVNAALAATMFEVPPGEYDTVVIHWTKNIDDGPNAWYRMDAWPEGETKDFFWGQSMDSDFVETPRFVVPPAATLRLTLHYNLDYMVLRNQSIDGCLPDIDPSCYAVGNTRWFIVGSPELSASLEEVTE